MILHVDMDAFYASVEQRDCPELVGRPVIVTGCEDLFGAAEQIARRIKQEIKSESALVASVGVAPNKFLAKIASDLEKPDALVIVAPEQVQEFLDRLPVGRLWGVGKVTGGALDRLGIRTIGQLRRLSPETLREHFGSQGDHFWKLARGIDDRSVVPDREAKSISHETTFAADISGAETLRAWLLDLTEQVCRPLRRQKQCGRTVDLKVRFADFRTVTRSRTLRNSTDVTDEIWQAASELLCDALPANQLGVRLFPCSANWQYPSAATPRRGGRRSPPAGCDLLLLLATFENHAFLTTRDSGTTSRNKNVGCD